MDTKQSYFAVVYEGEPGDYALPAAMFLDEAEAVDYAAAKGQREGTQCRVVQRTLERQVTISMRPGALDAMGGLYARDGITDCKPG